MIDHDDIDDCGNMEDIYDVMEALNTVIGMMLMIVAIWKIFRML